MWRNVVDPKEDGRKTTSNQHIEQNTTYRAKQTPSLSGIYIWDINCSHPSRGGYNLNNNVKQKHTYQTCLRVKHVLCLTNLFFAKVSCSPFCRDLAAFPRPPPLTTDLPEEPLQALTALPGHQHKRRMFCCPILLPMPVAL